MGYSSRRGQQRFGSKGKRRAHEVPASCQVRFCYSYQLRIVSELRICRALNVDVAQVLLTNALKWRKMFKIISTDKVMTSAYKNSSFTHFGHDKEGIPVMFVKTLVQLLFVLIVMVRYLKVSKINWERFRIDRIGALVYVLSGLPHTLAT